MPHGRGVDTERHQVGGRNTARIQLAFGDDAISALDANGHAFTPFHENYITQDQRGHSAAIWFEDHETTCLSEKDDVNWFKDEPLPVREVDGLWKLDLPKMLRTKTTWTRSAAEKQTSNALKQLEAVRADMKADRFATAADAAAALQRAVMDPVGLAEARKGL